ncbi:cullin-like protein, putative [Plasmodium malariae]|uniref:Cullin-like protein, putative n=1 Tax=Plasmodium malariae TaxID=5858 RepID=A0A1C3KZG2_PLAMA|nr:cullin-like protein, putative [Plasmodium malariae]
MDPSSFKNFPVFYVKNKEPVNIDSEYFSECIRSYEEYINGCFDFLPFNELVIDNEKKFLIERYCDFFVFYNCERVICTIIEEQCKKKTIHFFETLDLKINNKEFKNAEDFLKYFVNIWNNFLSVIIHLEDLLKSFNSYNKITYANFDSPSYIFNELWKEYTNNFPNIKNVLISSASDYLKCDKIYCETKFYQYICLNMHDEDTSYEEEGVDGCLDMKHRHRSNISISRTSNNGKGYKSFGCSSGDITSSSYDIRGSKESNNSNRCDRGHSVGKERFDWSKLDKDMNINNDTYNSEMEKVKEEKRGNVNSTCFVSHNTGDCQIKVKKNEENIHKSGSIKMVEKINDKLLSMSLKIIDMLGLYVELEQVYKNETYAYYKEKIDKQNEQNMENGYIMDTKQIYDFPNKIENYLCHEQMRCRKFLKEETEISILKMLKELLIVKHKDILFKEENIKYCIINEKYDSLRILYLFSLNLNSTEEFCRLFFKATETLGVELINDLISKRNNINALNDSFIHLLNFKLNIDRIIIMSFRYSSFFTKRWKEVFEHFLNKGMHAESYIPVILSIYLNNLMMMHNACLKKLRKYFILNKQLKNGENINKYLYEKSWKTYCTQPQIASKGEDIVSTDSETLFAVKKYLKNRKRKKKFLNSNKIFGLNVSKRYDDNNEENNGGKDGNEENGKKENGYDAYNGSSSSSSDSNNKKELHLHTKKIEKLFKKYHDIGKCIMNIITIVLSLFKYISDKEKFEKYYRIFMCKRLINDDSFNIILDIKVFKTLKKECGAQFTKKIETILKDMKFTSRILQNFYNELPRNSSKLLRRRKYFVNVIFNEIWDYSNIEDTIIYPQMIKLCNDYFYQYYKNYNKAKNIRFLPLFGLCTLKVNLARVSKKYTSWTNHFANASNNYDAVFAGNGSAEGPNGSSGIGGISSCNNTIKNCNSNDYGGNDADDNNGSIPNSQEKKKKKFFFTVTLLQAIVLLLFNEKNEYNISEINTQTGISNDNIIRYLKSLYSVDKTKILNYDEINQNFKLNVAFKSDSKYVIVNYSDVTYKDNEAIPALTQEDIELEDRSLHIDAGIVKFLKSDGKSSEKDICSYIKQKMNITSSEQIKNRIASLLSREFIFFQDNFYYYEL